MNNKYILYARIKKAMYGFEEGDLLMISMHSGKFGLACNGLHICTTVIDFEYLDFIGFWSKNIVIKTREAFHGLFS